MVEMLRRGRDSGFGLDGLLQCANCGIGRNFEREEVGIRVRGRGDVEGDAHLEGGRPSA